MLFPPNLIDPSLAVSSWLHVLLPVLLWILKIVAAKIIWKSLEPIFNRVWPW